MTVSIDEDKFQHATSDDGGILIERRTENGEPRVAIVVIVGGLGHRITLDPREALAAAWSLAHYAQQAGIEQNRISETRIATGSTTKGRPN